MNIITESRYNDIGPFLKIDIQLDYKDLEVFEFPATCINCPVGFCHNSDCGRNVPFEIDDGIHRPDTCKLHLFNYDKLIESLKTKCNNSEGITTLQSCINQLNDILDRMKAIHGQSEQCDSDDGIIHARWIEEKCGDGIFNYRFKCSHCGNYTPEGAFPVAPDYCPHCPAKMDGGE